jgi:hypothetical protein
MVKWLEHEILKIEEVKHSFQEVSSEDTFGEIYD